jgi:hypothetical protein
MKEPAINGWRATEENLRLRRTEPGVRLTAYYLTATFSAILLNGNSAEMKKLTDTHIKQIEDQVVGLVELKAAVRKMVVTSNEKNAQVLDLQRAIGETLIEVKGRFDSVSLQAGHYSQYCEQALGIPPSVRADYCKLARAWPDIKEAEKLEANGTFKFFYATSLRGRLNLARAYRRRLDGEEEYQYVSNNQTSKLRELKDAFARTKAELAEAREKLAVANARAAAAESKASELFELAEIVRKLTISAKAAPPRPAQAA